jgi:hypothetical protein
MKLKLVQSGGLMGKKLVSFAESGMTEEEWGELMNAIKADAATFKKKRDALHYSLQKNDDENTKISIDISRVPAKYLPVFKKLFENLRSEK